MDGGAAKAHIRMKYLALMSGELNGTVSCTGLRFRSVLGSVCAEAVTALRRVLTKHSLILMFTSQELSRCSKSSVDRGSMGSQLQAASLRSQGQTKI